MRRRGRIENFNIQEVENLKIKEQEKTDRVNWNDKEFRRNRMKEYIGKKLKDDREYILEAISQNIDALQYASEGLRNDKEFIMAAMKKNSEAVLYIGEQLKYDREFILEALKVNTFALGVASKELQNDKEFIMEASKVYGKSIRYASKELRNNKEFMIEVMKKYGGTNLQFASEELKNDREVVLEAIKKYPGAINYASERLQNNKEIKLECQKSMEKLRTEREEKTDRVNWNDKDEVLKRIRESNNGNRFKDASEEVVFEAMRRQNIDALQYASEELRNDKEFRRNRFKEYIVEKLKKENKQAVKDERRRKNR